MQTLMRRLLFALVFMAMPALAMAQESQSIENTVRQATAAAERGDDATARRLLAPIASNVQAAYILGVLDMEGRGGPVDYPAAIDHFTVSARQGHAGAVANLGVLYDRGTGLPRDGARAQEFFIVAAEAGLAAAKNNLAYLWARQNGLLPQALCLAAEALATEPDSIGYLDTYGFVLLRMNRAALAEAYFRKALDLAPDHPVLLEHLGDVAAMTGKGNAADSWRHALDRSIDDRQRARLSAKLGGAPPPGDLDAHPPFTLRDPGLPADCNVPAV